MTRSEEPVISDQLSVIKGSTTVLNATASALCVLG